MGSSNWPKTITENIDIRFGYNASSWVVYGATYIDYYINGEQLYRIY